MIEVRCNNKLYKFYDGSRIQDELLRQAATVTDIIDEGSDVPAESGSETAALYTHDAAALILEHFENLLDAKGITIPCSDPDEQAEREDDPDNGAKIYGTEYSDLLDSVEAEIIDAAEKAKAGAEIVPDVFSGTI